MEVGLRGPYRKFVDGGLKTKGLRKLMEVVQNFITPVQELCAAALTPVATGQGTEDTDDASQEVSKGGKGVKFTLMCTICIGEWEKCAGGVNYTITVC